MGCEHTRHCRDVGAASNLLECIHLHRKVSDRMKSFRLRRAARRPTCVRSAVLVASSQTAESDHLLTVLPVICWSYVPAVLVGRRRRLPADQARRDSPEFEPYRTDGPGGFYWGSCQFFPHGTAREGNSEILNPRPTVHIRLQVYPAYNISPYFMYRGNRDHCSRLDRANRDASERSRARAGPGLVGKTPRGDCAVRRVRVEDDRRLSAWNIAETDCKRWSFNNTSDGKNCDNSTINSTSPYALAWYRCRIERQLSIDSLAGPPGAAKKSHRIPYMLSMHMHVHPQVFMTGIRYIS